MQRPASLRVIESYVQPDVCGPCGGACCKQMPGAAMPEDFGAPDRRRMEQMLTDRLASGRWAIDWWEGDPRPGKNDLDRGYFVRPATAARRGRIFDPSWGGACTFHGPSGCEIFADRPSGCRGLRPASDYPGGCTVMHSDKVDAAIAWIPYHRILKRAAKRAS